MSWQDTLLSEPVRPWLRALVVAAGGLLAAGLFSQTTLYPRLSWWAEDGLQRRLAAAVPMDRVVVVDVDEGSMQRLQPRLGAWPYTRDVYATTHRFLVASGARAVAYDILFAEARDGDAAFATALDARAVLAAAALPYPYARPAPYHEQLASVSLQDAPDLPELAALARRWPDLTLPLATLTRSSGARVGVISTLVDEDGLVRRLASVHSAYDRLLPGFALAALLAARPGQRLELDGRRLRIGQHAWPLAADGSLTPLLPANIRELVVLPFHQVLDAAEGVPGHAHVADLVRDRIVLIGSSSAVLGDFAQTPVGRLPGLHVNALMLESLLAGHVLSPPQPWLDVALALLALALPVALAWRGTDLQPRVLPLGLGAGIVLLAAAAVGLAVVQQRSHWLFAAAAGLAAFGFALAVWLIALYQERQRLFYEKTAAQEANRLKTEFLNHMTHELRTPITAIMGFNKFNLYGDDIGRDQRLRHSAIIARNCDHLLALVNNNLDLARMEAGQLKLERAAHETRALLEDVVATLRLLAHNKGLALEQEVAPDMPPTLSLDAFRVRQVLINLVGNAIKFTERGRVTLAARWQDGELHCEVRDTGPGIPADSLERIFEPFQRAPGATASGTGLGLSITRKLVELMGGSLAARSQVGQGSVFEVRIPAPEAELPAPAPAAAPQAVTARLAGRVLIADDNADLRDLLQVQLGELGLACKAVGDGIEAIDAALAEPFAVVLLDMDMPFMDGYETVRVLRERGYTRPVIGFTAHQAGSPLERALIEGCDDVISKPVSPERLREVLAPYTGGAPRPRPSAAAAIPVQVDERLRALVVRFLANCGRDLARLRAALDGGDLGEARAIGHSLGGVGGSYGFEEITRIGRAIEERSLRGDARSVVGLAEQLEDYLARVQPEFR
jgi:signal transduction histidine kinase/CheY-like chemotaxis protein/HPt (histidine-containing phosphotransfer) domain-containing protein